MPKPYSMDLGERVAAHVEAGHSRRATAAHFGVSPSFVINLMTALRARGGLAPKPVGWAPHAKLEPHRDYLLLAGRGEGRHHHAGAGGGAFGAERCESRFRLALPLVHPQRPEL